MSVCDEWAKTPGKTFEGTNGDTATDHNHRYEEDIKLMHKLGLKTYRFSISWTRILPNGRGEINQQGVKFYHRLIDTLLKYDIEPMVTLYHWDLPLALQKEYGGGESKRLVEDFTHYAKTCFDEYDDKVKYWIVINEPNTFTYQGYVLGLHLPGEKKILKNLFTEEEKEVLQRASKNCDFIGVNYYQSTTVAYNPLENGVSEKV